MQRYARIASGLVVEIMLLPEGTDPAHAFHRSIADALVPAPADQVVVGWSWDGGAFAPPPPTPPPSIGQLKAYAADKRWRVETGGIVVGGIPVPTDDRAKVLLMGAASMMADADTAPYVSGAVSVTLTGAQFKALYAALTAHVQAAFSTQTAVLAGIEDGTITTVEQIDSAAWPSNG